MDDTMKMFIAGARAVRNKGEDLIEVYRTDGLSTEMFLKVMDFLKEEEALRDEIALAGVNEGAVPPLMDDLQRIADIRQQFEEFFKLLTAVETKRLH